MVLKLSGVTKKPRSNKSVKLGEEKLPQIS